MGGCGLLDVDSKLMSLKLNWLSRYLSSDGIWKYLFDYWINKASDKDLFGWFIFSNKCNLQNVLSTTPFYIEMIHAFQRAGGQLLCNFSCSLETDQVPSWNNNVITSDIDMVPFDSKLLKSFGIFHLQDVLVNGKLISFQQLAKKYKLRNINAGRLVARFHKHFDASLVNEKRSGPPNHIANWLVIPVDDDDVIPISETKAKSNYVNLIAKKFVPPKAQKVWQTVFNFSGNFDWTAVWKRDQKTPYWTLRTKN